MHTAYSLSILLPSIAGKPPMDAVGDVAFTPYEQAFFATHSIANKGERWRKGFLTITNISILVDTIDAPGNIKAERN